MENNNQLTKNEQCIKEVINKEKAIDKALKDFSKTLSDKGLDINRLTLSLSYIEPDITINKMIEPNKGG